MVAGAMISGAAAIFQLETYLILMCLWGAQGRDLLDSVSTEDYWKAKSVQVTPEQLLRDAEDVVVTAETLPNDVDALVKQLGDDQYTVRQAAREKLATYGSKAKPALEKALTSKDPEVVVSAKDLLDQMSQRGAVGREKQVRQLMAIRTLGETKEKSAVALLTKLSKSTTPFVAEYAQRALALVQEQPAPVVKPAGWAELDQDLALLPENVGLFGATQSGFAPARTLAEISTDMATTRSRAAASAQRLAASYQRAIQANILSYVEQTGNMRVTGMSLGVSDDFGDRNDAGWAVFIWHGTFDNTAILAQLREEKTRNRGDATAADESQKNDADVVMIANDMTIIIPDQNRFIMVACDDGAKGLQLVAQITTKLKTLKTAPAVANVGPWAQLRKQVPAEATTYLAVWKVSEAIQQELPMVNGIKEGVAWLTKGAEGKLVATLQATWNDAESLTAASAASEKLKTEAATQLKKDLEPVGAPKDGLSGSALLWVESLQIKTQDKQITASMEATPRLQETFIALLMQEARLHRNSGMGMGRPVPIGGGAVIEIAPAPVPPPN